VPPAAATLRTNLPAVLALVAKPNLVLDVLKHVVQITEVSPESAGVTRIVQVVGCATGAGLLLRGKLELAGLEDGRHGSVG